MLIVKVLFCFIFGSTMRLILRSKWYGPGMVAVITLIYAALGNLNSLWVEAILCSLSSTIGSLLGVRLAKLFNIKIAETDNVHDDDNIDSQL